MGGIINNKGQVIHKTKFYSENYDIKLNKSPPAFLHDYFITKSWAICIDHSLRADPTKMASSGYFDWNKNNNIKLGFLPKNNNNLCDNQNVEWYDLGILGFVWHCIGATESDDGKVTCWFPIFETDYSNIPIHLANEPPSYLHKVVIDTNTKSIEEIKKF